MINIPASGPDLSKRPDKLTPEALADIEHRVYIGGWRMIGDFDLLIDFAKV